MTTRQLHRTCTEFRQGLLGKRSSARMCRAVCYPLQGYLALLGVETILVEAEFLQENGSLWDHVWLALPDGRILDPTADQFAARAPKLGAVYVGPLPEVYTTWMTAHA